jgi:transposase
MTCASGSNRKSQAEFICKACGHRAHADVNAARNIRARALSKRALELTTDEAKIPARRETAAEVRRKSSGFRRGEA